NIFLVFTKNKKILPENKISSNILMINVLITQNYLESLNNISKKA
ncbi:hypothetical protein SAMN05421842_11185, partial [Clostridium uliginosum]